VHWREIAQIAKSAVFGEIIQVYSQLRMRRVFGWSGRGIHDEYSH
jgi:hypothetical protein